MGGWNGGGGRMTAAAAVNLLSISGGKDSTAMWIHAIERGEAVTCVFADTGNEHPDTYAYIEYLEATLGPIRRVRADFSGRIAGKRAFIEAKWAEHGISDEKIQRALAVLQPTGNPFLDLCLWKGRFPSTKARFCTQFLKVEVIEEQVTMPLLQAGHKLVSWQGVRADESYARSKLTEWDGDEAADFRIYRPLLHWTVEDVFAAHERHGVKPNPLYTQGMGRVGCMPCVNANKPELFEIGKRFPEEVARIREWEVLVTEASKRHGATFFSTAHDMPTGIDGWVEWSKTSHGGGQYDLLKAIDYEEVPSCSSVYGLCE